MISGGKLLLFIILLPFFSLAQSNFQPGVVVTLKGDSLRGYINYSGAENNPRTISFKPSAMGQVTKFTAKDIKYYSIAVGFVEEYQRYEGLLSANRIDINRVTAERDSTFKLNTVFLRVLQKGKNVILYSYSDNLKTRYFIAETTNSQPRELIYRLYYKIGESYGTARTIYENTYKEQLYSIGEKAGVMTTSLREYIRKVDFSEVSIITIVSKINGISETDTIKNNHSKSKPFKLILALIGFVIVAILVLEKAHL